MNNKWLSGLGIVLVSLPLSAIADNEFATAVSSGKAYANFNMRFEGVDQDNALQDASALTLRTRLGYQIGDYNGFSALVEVEDSRIIAGQDEFTVGPTDFNPGEYSVIADPETTELDQGFLQYKSSDGVFTTKLGRQVITYNGHRFVGHVGWRQDRQTFDAATIVYKPQDKLAMNYGYVTKRNRIFAEDGDIDAKDHLLNAGYTTPLGMLTGYVYLLEVDNTTRNGIDTYGFSFTGKQALDEVSLLYALEYASQDTAVGSNDFDADYLLLEGGVVLQKATIKLGYELLGSDDGNYGFSTPLATLHKFNGWSDQFLQTPAQGLQDVYISLSAKVEKANVILTYHDFGADESSEAIDDLGTEINLQITRKFADVFTAGLKFASYDAGDAAAGKVDTDKIWVWVTMGF